MLVGICKYSKFNESLLIHEIEKLFLKSSKEILSLNKKFNFSSFFKEVELLKILNSGVIISKVLLSNVSSQAIVLTHAGIKTEYLAQAGKP
jgi:hypothetical protein